MNFPVPPQLLAFSFGDKPLNPEQAVTVPCAIVDGDNPMKLLWLLDGQPINPDIGVSVVNLGARTAILTISALQALHAGNYTCLAENKAGKDHYSAQLVVNGIHS